MLVALWFNISFYIELYLKKLIFSWQLKESDKNTERTSTNWETESDNHQIKTGGATRAEGTRGQTLQVKTSKKTNKQENKE